MALALGLPDRFELLRELGRGGMGTVYEAIDRETGGRVALKRLTSKDVDVLALFKREYRALRDIHHPNLVGLGELFCEEGQWSFSMDLVDGPDFLEYVRRDGERLRAALLQLAQGLAALHAANRVHRDIKPPNVLVRKDGQVVILDFGLVAGLDADEDVTRDGGMVGTPGYMAPELVLGEQLTPESDLYSVGVMLFEALTGRKPFEGSAMDMMTAKVEGEAPSPRSVAPDVSDDLDALAKRLLARDPKERPSALEVVRSLRERVALDPPSGRTLHPTSMTNEVRRFFGREEELSVLEKAYRSTLDGAAACVLVEGESGIGKSLLVQRFVARMREEDPRIVVLPGRCYEKESVPYKAFDSVIDALVRKMLRMAPVDAAMLLPTHLGPLVQTFPIFRRVDVVAKQRSVTSRMDPLEIRSRAFTALREMFERLSQRMPLIVAIEDMQWSDQDSMGLLAELVREPSPPPFLLLLTARPSSEEHEAGARFREVLSPRTRALPLSRLPEAEATELARWLLAKLAPARVDRAAAIAHEAEGHALFIEQLARYVATDRAAAQGKLRLEDVLETSIQELEPAAHRLFSLLCVAGAPMPLTVLSQAAGITPGELGVAIADLRAQRFIRTASTDGFASVEPYHGRMRTAALACQTAEELKAGHERLARALEGSKHGAPHVLAELWRGAGDKDRAGELALKAAENAVDAFAFDRAATFYEWALERPSATQAEQHRIRVALGESLAKAGRGTHAASVYRAAARSAVDLEEQLDLDRRTAEQLLRIGEFDAGIVAVRQLLERVGLSWPRTPLTTVLTFLLLRAWRVLRGYRASSPKPAARTARETVRMDVCWAVTSGLGMCDNLRAAVFQQRYLSLALRSGDPRRISLGLSMECPYHARAGEAAWPSTRRVIDRALDAAKQTGNPYCIGMADLMAGGGTYLSGRFGDALSLLDRGQDRLRSECPGTFWEIVTGQLWLVTCLYWLGEGRALLERQPVYLREAADRGDIYGTLQMCVGYGNFAWLLLDDVTTARERAREVMRRWSHSAYRLEQWYALLADGNTELYAGDGVAALRRVEGDWAKLEASLLRRRVEIVRYASSHMRARALVAAAEASPGEREVHLGQVEPIAADMQRRRSKVSRALATLVQAGAAHVRGEEGATVTSLRASVDALENAETRLFAAAARRYLGKLVRGDEGAALVRQAETAMRAQSVRNVAAMCHCLAPGFGRLD
ncbi:MAG TPA: protein kinase [Polyangiaceae bacterium]